MLPAVRLWQDEEGRAFIQERIRLYTLVSLAIVFGFFVLDSTGWLVVGGSIDFPGADRLQFRGLATELTIAAALAGVAMLLNRGSRSWMVLYAIDGATTMLVCLGLTTMVWAIPKEVPIAVELVIFMAMQTLLFVHAALVPQPALRTVLLHLIAPLLLVVVAYRRALASLDPNWLRVWGNFYLLVSFVIIFAFVAGGLSYVIYGLRMKVQEVMKLGQYRLEGKLGEGGMGVVYRARHAMLRRATAVKMLRPESLGETALARFENEVRTTSRLTHPNTVAIYDFGRTPDGVFYYAMELLDGPSLAQAVAIGGPMPPRRVLHVLRQAAGALAEAHSLGLVHRDVKPQNIVLCRRGGIPDTVKVVDFGLVKDLEAPPDLQRSSTNILLGTPQYISPEAIRDPAQIDGRADLYSLGATAFFLLTGKPLFEGKTIVEICAKHLEMEPTPPSAVAVQQVPEAIDALVLRLVSKDPADRPDAASLEEELSQLDVTWTREEAEQWWSEYGSDLERLSLPSDVPEAMSVALDKRFES